MFVLLIGFFLFTLFPLQVPANRDDWWNAAWSYRQELTLGSITSDEFATYQPVDLTMRFDSPCWAASETAHSVRVICKNKKNFLELESQIYDLKYSDQNHILSCNLVFLIPQEADGTEQYFIYYHESQTTSPEYPDHVSVKESSYFYEPIPGYPLVSNFFQVSQHDTLRYVVALEGKFLWYTTAQSVTKLNRGSIDVTPKNSEAVASFEFAYYYGDEMWQYSSTSQILKTAEILCDGNLMVSFRIISRSTDDSLQTTAVYKYFYCPTDHERIQVHVVHEALKDCLVYEGANTDGVYASLQCGRIKSASISDLNFGKIYPYFHFYSKQDLIEEYLVNQHPESTRKDPAHWVLKTSDDVELGTDAWVSFDEGNTGAVHALLFGTTAVVKSGTDEYDGIQLKAYESNYPRLPGLDYAITAIQCARNAYDADQFRKDMVIPEGFVAEFDVEFFSSSHGGYPLIEKEAGIFQTLVSMKPSTDIDDVLGDECAKERFSLLVFVHGAPSFPFGSILSAVSGRHFSYITVEAHRNISLVSAGSAGRLPIQAAVSSDERLPLKNEAFKRVRMIDFRNFSLFKRFHFQDLQAGRYIIKVFKENPWLCDQRTFIGYTVVDITKNSSAHVLCRPQGSLMISLMDQQNLGVSGAQVLLMQEGMVVAQNTTDALGSAFLTAPCNRREPYQLKVVYQGFEVAQQPIRMRFSRILVPLKVHLDIQQYNWAVTLIDLWGLPLEVDVTPRLTSAAMMTHKIILPEQKSQNIFRFTNLIPAVYLLQIHYKSFLLEKEIRIPSDDALLVFQVEYPVSFHVFDSRGIILVGSTVQLIRGGITTERASNDSGAFFLVPAGMYLVRVVSQDNTVIGQRLLHVVGERNVDLLTSQQPLFPLIVLLFASVLAFVGILFAFLKKTPLYFLVAVIISVLIMSLLFPWWSLNGASPGIETSSALFLVPFHFISMTQTSEIIAGHFTLLPEVFIDIITLIHTLIVLVCLLASFTFIFIFLAKKRWLNVSLLIMLGFVVSSVLVFLVAMSAFAEVGVGSVMGQGTLDISLQGEDLEVPVWCQWGPGLGFWLYVIAGCILTVTLVIAVCDKKIV